MFAALIGRFLYPARTQEARWQYLAILAQFPQGESMSYRAPAGQTIVITRIGESPDADSFVALSSVCPHLGCQVHWESANDRFFCPCHNGVFNPEGQAIAGPPADAGQRLSRYPLLVENGLLFIKVSLSPLV